MLRWVEMFMTQSVQDTAMQVGGGSIIGGGVLAQVMDTKVNPAGLAAIISGVLVAAYPWYAKTVDARGLTKKIEELEATQTADKATAERLAAANKAEASVEIQLARQADINELANLRLELEDARRMVDRLLPKMEVAAKMIDVNSVAITKVADATGVPVDVAQKIGGKGPTNDKT